MDFKDIPKYINNNIIIPEVEGSPPLSKIEQSGEQHQIE